MEQSGRARMGVGEDEGGDTEEEGDDGDDEKEDVEDDEGEDEEEDEFEDEFECLTCRPKMIFSLPSALVKVRQKSQESKVNSCAARIFAG